MPDLHRDRRASGLPGAGAAGRHRTCGDFAARGLDILFVAAVRGAVLVQGIDVVGKRHVNAGKAEWPTRSPD
jgi:hypothetical protein